MLPPIMQDGLATMLFFTSVLMAVLSFEVILGWFKRGWFKRR